MTAYTVWAEYVAPDVPGVGPEFLLDATRDAVIEFCERTRAYHYDAAAINVVALTHTYTPVVPAGTVMWDVLRADHNGRQISPRTKAQLDNLITRWADSTTTGTPEFFYITPDRTQVRLVRTPAESLAGGLVLELALKPSRASTSCPDWMLEHHKDTVLEGAKWKLFAMQKKPWSNPQLGVYHMQRFASLCGGDSLMADRNNTRAPLRSTPQR